MAELTQKERLQPSLLDRLADDDPGQVRESREKRVLSLPRLRECVMRDLSWLMNTENMECVQNLSGARQVQSSVLNFGIPAMAGTNLSDADLTSLELQIQKSIVDFEPRIRPSTVQVRASMTEAISKKALSFEIEGELWAQPIPLQLFLRTEMDLETGDVTVTDNSRT